MNDDNDELNPGSGSKKEEKSEQSVVQKGKEKAEQAKKYYDKARKTADRTKKIAKAAKNSKWLHALAPIMPYIAYGLLILLIIIFIIGIIVFLVTMPGMVMEKLKQIFHEIGNKIAAFFGADTTEQIDDKQIYEVLDYLEDMGYDLKGYGFLSKFMTEADMTDLPDGLTASDVEVDNGVIRSKESGKIVKAESAFIFNYIMSDNYIYTVKNYNLVTQDGKSEKKGGILGFFKAIVDGVKAVCVKIVDLFSDQTLAYGKGMINLINEDGSEYNGSSSAVKVDAESKKLIITAGGNGNKFEYDMDGWTGRYGMPLEFLLSVHIATNMPDLAYDMVTFFPTEVRIKLLPASVSVEGVYKDIGTNAEITLEDVGDLGKNKFLESGLTSPNTDDRQCKAVEKFGVTCSEAGGCDWEKVDYTKYAAARDEGKPTKVEDGKYYIPNGKPCSVCKDFLADVKRRLNEVTVTGGTTYIPVITDVKEHWFRNVYFETDGSNENIVQTDEEYEAFMDERWSLYEKDEYNQDQLYELNDDGTVNKNKPWDGTKAEALEKEVAVAKLPKYNESYKDKTKYADAWATGVWSAYKYEDEEVQGQLTKPEYASEPTDDKDIISRLYIRTKVGRKVTQKREALRGETNAKIKRIFTTNYYFKYDANEDTAEVIDKLRTTVGASEGAKNDFHVGNLNGDKVTKDNPAGTGYSASTWKSNKKLSVTMNTGDEGDTTKKYTVEDFASRVDLNKDSLSAFSMLENTHTQDSDYIYKDFKELIVELGFFEKEELTSSIPKIFEWFIPEIGSGGYPLRNADKKENAYGTMAHSKQDNDAFKAHDIDAKYKGFVKEVANGPEAYSVNKAADPYEGSGVDENKYRNTNGVNFQTTNAVKFEDTSGNTSMDTVKGEPGGAKSPEEVSVEEFLKAAAEVHSKMEGTYWEYCAAGTHSGAADLHTQAGRTCPGNYATYEAASDPSRCTADCSSYVSWVLQAVEIMDKNHKNTSSTFYDEFKEYILTKAEALPLQEGDILLSDGHVQINGEEEGGSFIQYNAGSTSAIQGKPHAYDPDFYTHVIRLFDHKKQDKPYVGYKGGEAVVSPATGILLDYGTYTGAGEETDLSGLRKTDQEKGERLNYDLKYPYSGLTGVGTEGVEEGQVDPNAKEEDVGRIVYDKVGYAKILVLDDESYLKLESAIGTSKWGGSLYDKNKKTYRDALFNGDELDSYSTAQKTLYGYKEFIEKYKAFDLTGYIIYMDGFKPELPNPDRKMDGEDSDEEEDENIPLGSGVNLSMTYFRTHASSYEESMYEKDESFNYTNEDVKKRVKAEEKVKIAAAPLYLLGDQLFIKEGTVIGRTYGDKELVEELRGETYVDPKTLKDTDKLPDIIGNYIRICMRDTEDTVVENVEDYLKLDDIKRNSPDNDWVLFYFLPFESGAADTYYYGPNHSNHYSGPVCYGTCSSGETAVGIVQETNLTKNGMSNVRDQFIPFMSENYPEFYANFVSYATWGATDYWNDYCGGRAFESALKRCDDADHENFLHAQMEEAKKHYYEPLVKAHPWIKDKAKATQAEFLHLYLWGPATCKNVDACKGMTDEQCLDWVRNKIATTGSTAGAASNDPTRGRAFNEVEIGKGILDGRLSDADVEQFVRKADFDLIKERGVEQHEGVAGAS